MSVHRMVIEVRGKYGVCEHSELSQQDADWLVDFLRADDEGYSNDPGLVYHRADGAFEVEETRLLTDREILEPVNPDFAWIEDSLCTAPSD